MEGKGFGEIELHSVDRGHFAWICGVREEGV